MCTHTCVYTHVHTYTCAHTYTYVNTCTYIHSRTAHFHFLGHFLAFVVLSKQQLLLTCNLLISGLAGLETYRESGLGGGGRDEGMPVVVACGLFCQSTEFSLTCSDRGEHSSRTSSNLEIVNIRSLCIIYLPQHSHKPFSPPFLRVQCVFSYYSAVVLCA